MELENSKKSKNNQITRKKSKIFFSPKVWLVGAQIEGNCEGVHLEREKFQDFWLFWLFDIEGATFFNFFAISPKVWLVIAQIARNREGVHLER